MCGACPCDKQVPAAAAAGGGETAAVRRMPGSNVLWAVLRQYRSGEALIVYSSVGWLDWLAVGSGLGGSPCTAQHAGVPGKAPVEGAGPRCRLDELADDGVKQLVHSGRDASEVLLAFAEGKSRQRHVQLRRGHQLPRRLCIAHTAHRTSVNEAADRVSSHQVG